MPDWFFTSDLHGVSDKYEQVLALAAHGRPAAVILGGDLGPHALGNAGVRRQRLFLEGFLVEFARRLREASPGAELLLLMGNDDWRANHDVLEQHHGALWHALHERIVTVHGVHVAGLSWVPITPFHIKDWERWEDGGEEHPLRLEGVGSADGATHAITLDPAHRAPTIAEALAALAADARCAEAIHVLHSPPRDGACDVTRAGHHVGSRAIRAHLERVQPPLSLSGHIHESPSVSGAWRDRIGRCITVNPGQFDNPRVSGVWFDPASPDNTLRHTWR